MKRRVSRKIKSDYQAKDLKNPFFYQNSSSSGTLWLLIIVLILIISLFWFFFISSVFRIKNIDISGLSRVDSSEVRELIDRQIEQKKLIFLSQSNIFLFNREEASAQILADYNFSQINISKKLPKTLKVELNERPYAFIFQVGSDYYYASKDAYIIKDEVVSEEDKQKYPILENRSDVIKINDNSRLNLKEDYLSFVFKLHEALAYQNDLKPERYIIEQELNSLLVNFKDGPLVYFNLEKDPVLQFEDLTIVKKEKIRDNFNKTNYIDMRYGDLIFIN